jgi:serine/threonine-protein kinase RsbW
MGHSQKDSLVEVTIPSKPEFLRVVRLLVSGYASRWPIPIDEIENIKVAVSEACNTAIQNAGRPGVEETIKIRCWHEGASLIFEIKDESAGGSTAAAEERGLGMLLIRTIMDEVSIKTRPDRGTKITMKKTIASA